MRVLDTQSQVSYWGDTCPGTSSHCWETENVARCIPGESLYVFLSQQPTVIAVLFNLPESWNICEMIFFSFCCDFLT
jgi:hypothetical protein